MQTGNGKGQAMAAFGIGMGLLAWQAGDGPL
jgi:hypothetical protein